MNTTRLLAALAVALACTGQARADARTDEARRLIEAGQGAQAYALLVPLESARAGEPEFDLLLGIAALDAGEGTRAVFALERAVTVQPENARARAELARAYLAVGETDAARREFERVRSQPVPAEVKGTIDRFLSAADRLDDKTRPTLRGHVELAVGTDSNVNSASAGQSLAIPAFGGMPALLDPLSVQTGDKFLALGGGLRFRNPVGNGLSLTAGLGGSVRHHPTDEIWDLGNVDGNAGLLWESGADSWSLAYQHSTLRLQSDRYRAANGVGAQWQRQLGPEDQVAAFLQYSRLSYPAQDLRNADRWVAGGAYAHGFGNGLTAFAGAYAGTERERSDAVPHLGHRLAGLRLGGEYSLTAAAALFANLSYEGRRYGGTEPLFFEARRDRQWNLQLGANLGLARNWLLTPQLSATRNESSIGLYDYRRRVASLNLRHDF